MSKKFTESKLKKMIREEFEKYQNMPVEKPIEPTIDKKKKKRKADEVISSIYQMIMKGQIDAAKKALAADPEIQAMADEVDKLTYDLGKKLQKDENFLNYLLKNIDDIKKHKM